MPLMKSHGTRRERRLIIAEIGGRAGQRHREVIHIDRSRKIAGVGCARAGLAINGEHDSAAIHNRNHHRIGVRCRGRRLHNVLHVRRA